MDSHSPQTTCEMWLKAGVARHKAGPAKSFVKGIMGGVLLSFGGILALDVGAFLAPNYLGLNRFIAAAGESHDLSHTTPLATRPYR